MSEQYTKLNDVQAEIMGEIYKAFVLLGAQSDLLGSIGSFGDSLPDEDVLAGLQAWNIGTEKELKGRVAVFRGEEVRQ